MKFITRKERNSTRVSLFFCALLPFTFNDPKISWSWNWEKKAWSVRDGDKVLASIDKNGSTLSIIYEDFDGKKLPANKITGTSNWDSV